MEAKDQHKNQYSRFKSRWRHSINQFSKLQEQSKLVVLDTVQRNVSSMRLKMKNRLAQIDEAWNPLPSKRKTLQQNAQRNDKCKVASTRHDTNILSLQSYGSDPHLQQSLVMSYHELNPQQNDVKIAYTCHQIRQQIVEELTDYNRSKYVQEMKQNCSKYSQSMKSMFYSLVNHQKKQLYEFCYMCDQVVSNDKSSSNPNHKCKNQLNSIISLQQALVNLKAFVQEQNNKIFHIFLHNALLPNINIDELITNVTVLKQSIELKYEPEEAVLRMRLMNLMGKKIGLLIEEKDLEQRLQSLWKSNR